MSTSIDRRPPDRRRRWRTRCGAGRWSRTGSCAPAGARRPRCAGAVGVVADHLQRRALDARHFAVGLLEHLDAESLAVAVLQVHALERRRPVLRLGAARPAWMSTKQLLGSSGLENMRRNSSSATSFSSFAASRQIPCERGVVASARASSKSSAASASPPSTRAACRPRRRAPSFPCRAPARAAGSPRAGSSSSCSALRGGAALLRSQRYLRSSADRACRSGERGGDLVDAFGFHAELSHGTLSSQ